MATFASVDELNVLLGTQDSKANTGPAGHLAVNAATSNIIAALGWDPRQSERTIGVDAARRIILPARNITALAIAEASGVAVPVTAYSWTADGIVDFPYAWARWGRRLTVTLTAGWPDGQWPEVLKTVCLEESARWLDARGQKLRSHAWSLGEGHQESESFDPRAADLHNDPRLSDLRSPAVA
jgi:hypothetical protein